MIVVGVTGGIASGKSEVTKHLVEWGAAHFDADQAGHQVLGEDAVIEQLTQRWGRGILDQHGDVVRKEIAERVFKDTEQGRADLEFLNSVTHPRIRVAFEQQKRDCDAPMMVVDAALLLEADWDQWCDVVLFVETPDAIRRERAMQRGWSEGHWQLRESTQLPLAEKRLRATHVIDNSGSVAELENCLRPLASRWMK